MELANTNTGAAPPRPPRRPPHHLLPPLFQQGLGGVQVDAARQLVVLFGRAAGNAGEVEQQVDGRPLGQRRAQGRRVAHVERQLAHTLARRAREGLVHQRELANGAPAQRAARHQAMRQSAPQETGRAGDQHVHGVPVRSQAGWAAAAIATARWSITPNGPSAPPSKRACMRTRSPKRMKPGGILPWSIFSITRRSAMQAEPAARDTLETVPEPTMLPVVSRRVRAAWAMSWPKWKFISPPCGAPKRSPFHCTCSRICTRPSRQALPSSSGVTATGAKAVEGLACRKPKPVFISCGPSARRLQSLICTTRRTQASAASGDTPMGTGPVTTPNSPSKSIPSASLGRGTSSNGPRKSSLAPWYITGTLSNSGMGGVLKACSIRRPWFRKAEPSSHCGQRGRGAAQAAGSKSKAPGALPALSDSDRSDSGSWTCSQRRRASIRLGATASARTARCPSREARTRSEEH